jgi:hypothetical protein
MHGDDIVLLTLSHSRCRKHLCCAMAKVNGSALCRDFVLACSCHWDDVQLLLPPLAICTT